MNCRFYLFALCATFMLGTTCSAKLKKCNEYKIQVVKEYAHQTDAFTQGLFFYDGRLFESTGLYGMSSFRELELETGKVLNKFDIKSKYFAEGSVILGDKLFILTWTNRVAFVYNASTLKYEKSYSYPREGWGLTTDGEQLIASDGSDQIYFLDSEFKLQRSIKVKLNGRALPNLNELEYIDGKIWANIFLTDSIAIINPNSGEVEALVDCSGLLPSSLRSEDTDVLNGIAYDEANSKIYITGKNWPRLYEIILK